MPRKATLSPAQETALAALLAGRSVTNAAAETDVDRATVHRWLRDDVVFGAALNRGRRELRDAMQTRLERIGEQAAAAVETAVAAGDVQASLAVLRGLGLLPGKVSKIGSDDAGELAEDRKSEQKWRNFAR